MRVWLLRICLSGLALAAAVLTTVAAARLTGRQTLIVEGNSMGDAVPIGSLALAEVVEPAAIQEGDIIVIRNTPSATPYIHRVTAFAEDSEAIAVHTRGDANATADPLPYVLPA